MGKRRAGLALAVLGLLWAAPVFSQVIVNPRTVEFIPSADHSAVAADGQSVVLRYDLDIYPAGAAQSLYTVDLGKPAPDADGKIRVDFASRLATWPLPNGSYEARVAAVGTTGQGLSDPSNQFAFQSCSFGVAPLTRSIGAAGGTTTISVTADAGCGWSASSSAAWISASPASGSGSAMVTLTVPANPGSTLRSGTVTIAGLTVTVSQDTVSCPYSLGSNSQTFGGAGGMGTVSVTTIAGCAWTAASTAGWVSLSPAGGTGAGAVSITVSANTSSNPRTAPLTIAGQPFTVTQDALSCTYTLASASASLAASGGSSSVTVTAAGGCTWTALSPVSWVTVSPGSGNGTGPATFSVAANPTTARRSASLTIAGQAFTVTQDGLSCSYALASASATIAASGGSSSVTVTAPGGCTWAALSPVSWVTASPGSGSGTGTITFSVAANTTSAARTATMTIAGQAFNISQDAPACSFTLNGASSSLSASGGSGSVTVTAANGCTWTAASPVSWVTVSPASGSGTGTMTFSVAANTTTANRSATLAIAGQAFTVTQDGLSCSFTLASASATIVASGGSGSVTVTAADGCTWTAASPVSWVTVSPASGSGTGTVTFSVAANTTAATRSATLTVAGQPFTVTQDGLSCNYGLANASATVAATGGNASVTVTAPNGCAWSAASPVNWVTVSPASGNGSGTATFTVAANSASTSRSATLTIAGKPFTVTEDGAVCAYKLAYTMIRVGADGGSTALALSCPTDCAWSAKSNASWLSLAASFGTGPASVTFTAAANTSGLSRNGTITIGGTVVTIYQDAKAGPQAPRGLKIIPKKK